MGIAKTFNTPLSVMDRLSGQKINKDIGNLSNTLNQLYLAATYRICPHNNHRIIVIVA